MAVSSSDLEALVKELPGLLRQRPDLRGPLYSALVDEESFLKVLPEILKQRPDLRVPLYAVLMEEFSPRAENERLLQEIHALRIEGTQRAEEAKRHFEQIDRRFEQIDRRFEQVERRFEQVDRRFEEVGRRFEYLTGYVQDIGRKVDLQVGGFQRRAGRNLEDLVAGTLRLGLGLRDITAEQVKLRQKVLDTDGMMGPAGRSYELDLLVYDGVTLVFEVKSVPDEEDVVRLTDKVALVRRVLGKPEAKGALVTLAKDTELERACQEHGILLV